MKKVACIILGGILFFASSCNVDEHLPVNGMPEGNVKIIANAPQRGGETKVAFNDDEAARVLYADWKESGEKFSVVRGGENATFTQTSSTEDEKNVFEGTCPDAEGSGLYYAIYPYNEQVTDVTAVPFDLSEQNGTLDENRTYMYACSDNISDGSELDFRQMTAILKPKFNLQSGEKVMTVLITLPEGTYSKGTFNVSDLTVTPGNDNKRSINVFANNAEKIYIYLPAIEVTETKEIALEVHTTTSMYTGTVQLTKSIKSGTLYETELNLTATPDYVWTSGTSATTPTGDGTEGSPYQIVTAGHLQWLLSSVNNNTDDANPTEGKYYKLMHNLVITSSTSSPWTPIGRDDESYLEFAGVFDGNGYIISGTLISQYQNNTLNDRLYFGLFGQLRNNSNIKNMILNFNITGGRTFKENPSAGSAKYSSTGAVAGRSYGVIENCTSYGKVTGGVAGGYPWDAVNASHTGGVVGLNLGTVKNCINYSNVIGEDGNGGSMAGGIAGRDGMYWTGSQYGYIESCINYGRIEGYSGGSAGGIVGFQEYGAVKSCINYGEVTIPSGYKAGIAGELSDARGDVCTCNKDFSSLNTIVGNTTPTQIDGCTGDHS